MIRAMAQADLPAVLAIASNAFDRDHAQRAQPEFNEMFSSAALRPFFYVAEVGGKVVGVAGYGEAGSLTASMNCFGLGCSRKIASNNSAGSWSNVASPIWRRSGTKSFW
jgi:hypothetical protein